MRIGGVGGAGYGGKGSVLMRGEILECAGLRSLKAHSVAVGAGAWECVKKRRRDEGRRDERKKMIEKEDYEK